jgi:hypothetical protein
LLERPIQLIQFLLCFENTFQLIIGFFLFVLVLFLQYLVLLLTLHLIPLNDVVVIVGSFEFGLHFGKLMLDTIELHTGFLSVFLDFTDFFFFFSELKIDSLVLVGQLFGQGILQSCHQRL